MKIYFIILSFLICFSCNEIDIDDEVNVNDDVEVSSVYDGSILLKENLKILDIGNSYTTDATYCLPFLIEKLNVDVSDMCLFKAIRGGGSFKDWYNVYYDKDPSSYEIVRVIGEGDCAVKDSTGKMFDGSLLRSVLTVEKWDIILIHQLGRYCTDYDDWLGLGDAGYLKELISIIKENQPQSAIGFLFTHTSSSNYPTNKEHSSLQRWNNSVTAIQRMISDFNIAPIVPYGTAIQNLRSSSLNDSNELTRDGAHLGQGLARYTAACCYYELLIAPRTKVSMLGKEIDYYVGNEEETSRISVTEMNRMTAQKAAALAVLHPFMCLNPDEYGLQLEEL